MRISLVLALGLAVAGCANITPRNDPPKAVHYTNMNLNDAVACVINALNFKMRDAGAAGITHRADAIIPDRTYEIVPQQTIAPAGELYFIRVSRDGDRVKIEDFFIETWRSSVGGVTQQCVT